MSNPLSRYRHRIAVRQALADMGNTFGAIRFVKKTTGEVRHMQIRFGAGEIVGSDLGQQMAFTRKLNNPDLVNVWARGADKITGAPVWGWRSFHLDNVLAIRSKGRTIEFKKAPTPFID